MRLNSSLKVVLLSMVSFAALISTWDGIFYPGAYSSQGEHGSQRKLNRDSSEAERSSV
jgi:hypothetical protein